MEPSRNTLKNVLPYCTKLDTIRLWFFGLSAAHLIVTAIVTLTIDMTGDDDPKIRMYWYVRWLLLTCWVNMITLFYLPVSFYCEWKRKYNNSNMNNVEILDDIRDITMTSIIFPFTVFSDICFWLLWYTDPTLIAPVRIFDYLPHWAQHSLHTVSFLVVILDLLLVPRRRPASLVPAFIMSTAFCTLYYVVISVATLMQCYVYEFLKTITALQWLSLTLFAMLISMIIIYLEWVVIEIVWRPTKYKVKSN